MNWKRTLGWILVAPAILFVVIVLGGMLYLAGWTAILFVGFMAMTGYGVYLLDE